MAPIGGSGSRVRRQSDQVLRHLIVPACEVVSHTAVRADAIHAAGHITAQVMELISSAPLAVADVSGLNPNVMYELAVRHVIGKPVAQIATAGTKLPFDVGTLRTVFFNMADPDDVARAKNDLQQQLTALIREPGRFRAASTPTHDVVSVHLNDEQTRSVIWLHQASSGFRIYRVIDDTVSLVEEHPEAFDPEDFYLGIRNALAESRRNCATLTSRRLGNLFQFYEQTLSDAELRKIVEGGQRILLDANLDSGTKRKKLLAYVHNAQLALDERIEKLLRGDA